MREPFLIFEIALHRMGYSSNESYGNKYHIVSFLQIDDTVSDISLRHLADVCSKKLLSMSLLIVV